MTQLLPRRLHALMDYPVALGLIFTPFVLGIGADSATAFTLSIGAGLGLLLLATLTDYEGGLLPVINYRAHLAIDALSGTGFVFAPLVFSFKGLELTYFLVVGAMLLAAVLLHRDDTLPVPQPTD